MDYNKDIAAILRRDFSDEFVAKMKMSIVQAHFRYGWVSDSYPEISDAMASAQQRLDLYMQTGNADYLVDVANFVMIEFSHPKHPNAHFRRCSSDESPGVVGGSYKEMMDEMKQDEIGYIAPG